MRFYELVFIVRQDMSFNEVEKIIDVLTKILISNESNVIHQEYWGLRSLAYEILNNKKGHYVYLGIKANNAALSELRHKIKLNESIIRFLFTEVDNITTEISPILKQRSTQQVLDK